MPFGSGQRRPRRRPKAAASASVFCVCCPGATDIPQDRIALQVASRRVRRASATSPDLGSRARPLPQPADIANTLARPAPRPDMPENRGTNPVRAASQPVRMCKLPHHKKPQDTHKMPQTTPIETNFDKILALRAKRLLPMHEPIAPRWPWRSSPDRVP